VKTLEILVIGVGRRATIRC